MGHVKGNAFTTAYPSYISLWRLRSCEINQYSKIWDLEVTKCGDLPWYNPIEEDNSGYTNIVADGKGLCVWPSCKCTIQPINSPSFGLRGICKDLWTLLDVALLWLVTKGPLLQLKPQGPIKCRSATDGNQMSIRSTLRVQCIK